MTPMSLRPLTGIRASLTKVGTHFADLAHPGSPSPYGDSCFSDPLEPPLWKPSHPGLRPLTGIRASLTSGRQVNVLQLLSVSVPLRGFVLL